MENIEIIEFIIIGALICLQFYFLYLVSKKSNMISTLLPSRDDIKVSQERLGDKDHNYSNINVVYEGLKMPSIEESHLDNEESHLDNEESNYEESNGGSKIKFFNTMRRVPGKETYMFMNKYSCGEANALVKLEVSSTGDKALFYPHALSKRFVIARNREFFNSTFITSSENQLNDNDPAMCISPGECLLHPHGWEVVIRCIIKY